MELNQLFETTLQASKDIYKLFQEEGLFDISDTMKEQEEKLKTSIEILSYFQEKGLIESRESADLLSNILDETDQCLQSMFAYLRQSQQELAKEEKVIISYGKINELDSKPNNPSNAF